MARKPTSPFEFATLWFTAPFVIASRLQRLQGPGLATAKGQAEAMRMVSEKMQAIGESAIEMQFALAREMMRPAMGTRSAAASAAAVDRVVTKGLKPYTRRVKANAKRLAK